jgi:hypothetical protein
MAPNRSQDPNCLKDSFGDKNNIRRSFSDLYPGSIRYVAIKTRRGFQVAKTYVETYLAEHHLRTFTPQLILFTIHPPIPPTTVKLSFPTETAPTHAPPSTTTYPSKATARHRLPCMTPRTRRSSDPPIEPPLARCGARRKVVFSWFRSRRVRRTAAWDGLMRDWVSGFGRWG